MTVLCAMLYALLTAADYWLLGGSLLRFGLLAVVMIATRRIDLYGLTAPAQRSPRSPRQELERRPGSLSSPLAILAPLLLCIHASAALERDIQLALPLIIRIIEACFDVLAQKSRRPLSTYCVEKPLNDHASVVSQT